MSAQNVFSRHATRRGHDTAFGKKRYLFRIVYRGEHFCRVSELCDLNSLQECKMKRNLKVAPFLTLVARGGPVAPCDRLSKTVQYRHCPIHLAMLMRNFRALASNSLGCSIARLKCTRSVARTTTTTTTTIKRIVPIL